MNIKHLLATLMLGISITASADLIYDEGAAPSHGPAGEEVTIQDATPNDQAVETGPNDANIETSEEFDANDVDDDEVEELEEQDFETEVAP